MFPFMPLKPLWHLSCAFRAVFLALSVFSFWTPAGDVSCFTYWLRSHTNRPSPVHHCTTSTGRTNINLAVQNLRNHGILTLVKKTGTGELQIKKGGVGLEIWCFFCLNISLFKNALLLKAKKHSAKPFKLLKSMQGYGSATQQCRSPGCGGGGVAHSVSGFVLVADAGVQSQLS